MAELKVGDILQERGGYDASWCTYWKVLKVTSSMATVAPMKAEYKMTRDGEVALPKKDSEDLSEKKTRKIGTFMGVPAVRIESGSWAKLWDGKRGAVVYDR